MLFSTSDYRNRDFDRFIHHELLLNSKIVILAVGLSVLIIRIISKQIIAETLEFVSCIGSICRSYSHYTGRDCNLYADVDNRIQKYNKRNFM